VHADQEGWRAAGLVCTHSSSTPSRATLHPPPPLHDPQKRVCPRGTECPFAHSMTEYFLHPSRYRTQMCNDGGK